MTKYIYWLACAALLATVLPTRADEEEDQYFLVLGIIEKADALNGSGQTGKALTKYQQAQTSLESFRRSYPDWNPKVIAYRTKYLAKKIALCSEKISTPAAAAGQPSDNKPGASPDNQSAEQSSGVQLKLLEAGSQPRKVLRLHPKAGDKQTLALTLKMGMAMKMGELENPPIKLPSTTMTMDISVKNVSPEGDISSELVMTDATVADEPGVMPQVAEAMKSSLGNLKGLSGKGVTSDRGVNKATEINVPAGADPQVRQAMDQMKDSFANLATPLPNEPVGAGAKWEVKMPLKSQGMSINQTATYEVISLAGDDLKTRVTIDQTAPKQKVQNPAMPALKLDLTKMSGTGSGELTLNLGQLLPVAGAITSRTELSMGVGTGAEQQTMSMKIDLDLHIEAK